MRFWRYPRRSGNFQIVTKHNNRIEIESLYIFGKVDINDATSVRFPWLNDAISGASPTGPQSPNQPYSADVEGVRTDILGAILRQFGDHRVDLEISRSSEDDYYSKGIALSDAWEINQKNTTLSYGINYLDDRVLSGSTHRDKHSDDLFTGVRQHGLSDALIDLSRDLFAMGGKGHPPFWHVGIEDGCKPGECWGGLAVSDRAVSASGDYAHHFTHDGIRCGHILDPRTGWPVLNGMRAATVIAPSCLEAGIYSTAVFVLARPRRRGLCAGRVWHRRLTQFWKVAR